MAVLAACQSAMVRLVGRKPATIFSTTNQMEVEIGDLVTDVAVDIMKSHDWRALTKIHSLTGDGSTSAFAMPDDYDRMALAQGVADANNWMWGYTPVATLDEWITITTSGFNAITPGWWIILDGQFQFSPAPTSGAEARFPYISNYIGTSAGLAPLTAFSVDTDTSKLPERLLTLGLIYRWKAMKGFEYGEDMAAYETALSQAQARDKGASIIRKGQPTMSGLNTHLAWPWELG